MIRKMIASFAIVAMSLTIAGCGADNTQSINDNQSNSSSSSQQQNTAKSSLKAGEHVTVQTTVNDVINAPEFKGFGQFLFPTEDGMPDAGIRLNNINSLLPYHSHINTTTTVNVINSLVDARQKSEKVFYNIYSDEEIQKDPSKRNTGLFFFQGQKDAPYAVISAGGGFQYVGSIHESMPHALEISKKGYNAFTVQYRTGGEDVAAEDLAAAISFINRNAKELKVDPSNYSVWGGSAGARMAADIGSYSPKRFGGDTSARPAAVIMQYTGRTDYTRNDPATYAVVGDDDGIANWRTMQTRINNLKRVGVKTEFHHYPNLEHGFGLGIGTSAQGWLNDAVAFWEQQMNANQRR